jgi:hypothetical protein
LVVVKVPYEVPDSSSCDGRTFGTRKKETMRQRLMALATAVAAAGLVLTACTADPGSDEEIAPGFEDCADSPNTCNTGERGMGVG